MLYLFYLTFPNVSLKKYSYLWLYMPAWQHLVFLLREQIKATSKQACYCSAAWVPASKKQADDYLAEAVKENCKFSTSVDFFVCVYFILFFGWLVGGVSFNIEVSQTYRWQGWSS